MSILNEMIEKERRIIEKCKTEYEFECARYGIKTVESCEKLDCVKLEEEHNEILNFFEKLKMYCENSYSLLEKSAEEIENIYGSETELSKKIRELLQTSNHIYGENK